jgi:acyl carrier protein
VGVVMLPMEMVFNYPSIAALAGFLTDGLVSPAPTPRAADRAVALQQQVLAVVASVLGQQVTIDEPLVDAGMDSISANELRSQLASAVGLAMLPAEVVFDYPTVKDLVTFLEAYVDDDARAAPVDREVATAAGAGAPHTVASAVTIDTIDEFVSSLKDMLAEALVLEGAWPSAYDDVPFGELGLSSELLSVVRDHFRVQVQMSEHDTLAGILLAIRALLAA